jgi:hypothetical protein
MMPRLALALLPALIAVVSSSTLAQAGAPMPPSASRPAARVIPPITSNGVRYESRWSDNGVLFAVDEKSGKPLWKVEVFKYLIDESVETDVQVVFAKSMELSSDGQTILLEDERGIRHAIDLKARTSRTLTWPVSVKLDEAKPGPSGWSYKVSIEVRNSLTRLMRLDGPSVAERGDLANNLFEVKVDGRAVSYNGMMAKRAPPKRFIELKPGEHFRTVVELGSEYPIPPGEHQVEVRFSHRNHFSPDAFDLQSGPLKFTLGGAGVSGASKPRAPR